MAAVSDFKVAKPISGKLSSDRSINLRLTPQIKIIDQIKNMSPKTTLVVFKAEYGLSEEKLIEEAVKKLKDSKADFIIANDISRADRGFESDDNEVYIISKNGKVKKISLTSKKEIAKKIIDSLFVIPDTYRQ